MKFNLPVCCAILLWGLALPVPSSIAAELPVPGDAIGRLTFDALNYDTVHLEKSAGKQAYVLFFFSNTCPVARRYQHRIGELEAQYREKDVQFIAVNASPADSIIDVARHAMSYQIDFPVVKDGDFSAVRALGITRTPEAVVLDGDLVLRYRGRVDDQYRLGGVTPRAGRPDLALAIQEVLDGRAISEPITQAEGCAITFPLLPSPDAPLTFDGDIRPRLAQYCLNCHVAGGLAPFSLDTPGALVERKHALLDALRLDRMPPSYTATDSPLLDVRRLPYRDRHMIANWLGAAPEAPATPQSERSNAVPAPEPQFVLRAAVAVERNGDAEIVDLVLEPLPPGASWLRAIAVTGDVAKGFHWGAIYYFFPERPETRTALTGPILPGLPLRWGNADAMRVPAGARLGLTVRYREAGVTGPDTPALTLDVCDAPARAIHCQELAATVGTRSHALPARASADGAGFGLVAIAVQTEIPAVGFTLALENNDSDGEEIVLLSLPVSDPAWPLTYRFADTAPPLTAGARLHTTLFEPGYLRPLQEEAVDRPEVEGDSAAHVYLYTAEGMTDPAP